MPLTRTLAQFRDAVQRTAGIVAFVGTGKRHSQDQVDDNINRGFGALQRITAAIDPEFRPIASTTFTTDGSATEYGLPINCRSVLAVHYTIDGKSVWLTPYELPERPALINMTTDSSSTRAHHYKVLGSNIEFLPRPASGHTVLLWYAPTVTQLSSPTSAADVFERLDDYVIWWAAREIAMDREDYERHDRLTQKIEGMEEQIAICARSRDLSQPARIVDLRMADRYGRWRRTR